MKTLKVDCGASGAYNLFIGKNARSLVEQEIPLEKFSKIFVVTEPVIEEKWGAALPAHLRSAQRIIIPSGESSKTVQSVEKVWEFLLSNGADRKSLLVNIGGGMITDLGGFAASTYMRGISFIHLPTTLLSQVDASIGGKTGVNFGQTKNIIGTFRQPAAVFIDTEFLSTLPKRELRAGLAEVLKHGLIRDKEYFTEVSQRVQADEEFSSDYSELVISRSCEIKRDVVAEDETEKGVRKLLNFGHTFGHAFESLSHIHGEPLLHGEAVSIGMVAEALLSKRLGLLSDEDIIHIQEGISAARLPIALPEKYPFDEILPLLERDKKNTGGKISWTLLSRIGAGIVDQAADIDEVKGAYEEL